MNSERRKPQWLFWLSIMLFAGSLLAPVEKGNGGSPIGGGNTFGWQLFVLSFWGLVTIEEVTTQPAQFFYILSGAVTNVLVLVSWVAIRKRSLRRFARWTSGCAVLLASVTLFRQPLFLLEEGLWGSGYWLWLIASIVLFGAALAKESIVQKPECHDIV
jgi:hypothetical protein